MKRGREGEEGRMEKRGEKWKKRERKGEGE